MEDSRRKVTEEHIFRTFLKSWALQEGSEGGAQLSPKADPCSTSLKSSDPIPMVPYGEVMKNEESLLEMTRALERYGICIVHGAPQEKGIVKPFVSRIAPADEYSVW